MYATITDYASWFSDEIQDDEFNRLCMEADRILDIYTTGIDNIKKLRIAFPTDENDAAAVKYAACKLINFLKQLSDAETSAASARGYTEGANGLQGKAVSSISAGNESISFTSGSDATAIDKAIADPEEKKKLIHNMMTDFLSGLTDANGVNLLYMGSYPVRITNV